MYLNSINDLHTVIQSTDYYKQKRPSEKPVLIDKVNFLINSIHSGNRHIWDLKDFESVPLHRDLLRKMLGRYEADIILDLLKELNIIEVDKRYQSTSFIKAYNELRKKEGKNPLDLKPESRKYGLTEKAKEMNISQVGVLSPRMEKKIFKYRKETLEYYMQDTEVHSKIISSLFQLKYNPKHPKVIQALKDTEQDKDKNLFFRETHKTLQEINVYTEVSQYIENSNFYYMKSRKVGRIFHYFATTPKKLRESLSLKNGKSISEIDLKNSQPLIIALNYLNRKPVHSKSDKKLMQDVLGGNFYNRIAEIALKNNDSKTANLFIENYSKFKARVLGQGLYFNYIPKLDKIKPMERYLMEAYPQFMQYVRNRKLSKCKEIGYTEGFKIVAQEAQSIESGIFIEGIYKDLDPNIFAVPVHDSLLVETDKVEQFKEKLVESFQKKFPMLDKETIRLLFSTTHYTNE